MTVNNLHEPEAQPRRVERRQGVVRRQLAGHGRLLGLSSPPSHSRRSRVVDDVKGFWSKVSRLHSLVE